MCKSKKSKPTGGQATDFRADATAVIVASTIGAGTEIYRCASIANSRVGEKCTAGDFSRVHGSSLGDYVKIDRFSLLHKTTIGDFSYAGPFDMIFCAQIGRFCSISWGVTIGPAEHDYRRIASHSFVYDGAFELMPPDAAPAYDIFSRPIKIGHDVWIGANSTILRGVAIGDGAVIGANSVVTKDVPPYAIVVGAPAKVTKFRFDRKTIARLLRLQWWNFPREEIRRQHANFAQGDVTNAISALAASRHTPTSRYSARPKPNPASERMRAPLAKTRAIFQSPARAA